jgi:hypothetical protein
MTVSSLQKGFRYDKDNARLSTYVNGTEVSRATATQVVDLVPTLAQRVATIKTSGAGYTITAAELVGGFIEDTSATGGIAATLPAAADVIALVGAAVGTSFYFTYANPGNQTVTITAATAFTIVGTATIATLNVKTFLCRVASATAMVAYSMGTSVY